MVTGEPDFLAGACQSLTEAGARIGLVLSSVDSPQLGRIEAERVVVGDLEDAEKLQSEYDLIIGNFHAEALARRYGKALVPRGFPCWEMIGNQLKNDLLYEGGAYFLCEAANAAEAMRMQHHAV
jgi:nitrogenase molybdenum-iron protein NifN